MTLVTQAVLLFALNFLDAVLTIYWVKNGHATEGNQLMARLLEVGNMPFLRNQILVGPIAAMVFVRWGHLRLARAGLAFTLTLYVALMGVHLFTGLSVSGFLSETMVQNIAAWTGQVLGFFF